MGHAETVGEARGSIGLKKKIGAVLILLFAIVVILAVLVYTIFGHEINTLSTIQKMDDFPLYSMDYDGDYGFDEFLKVGAKDDGELVSFITKRLLKGLPIQLDIPDLGCSTFNARTPEGDAIFGRNFDLTYSPGMIVRTTPDNGYRSISMVNLGFLGYNESKLPDDFKSSILTLAAPYIPLDGVNEKGLSIGVLLIPDEPTRQNTGKVGINTTTAVRLVLDKASTVDEAVSLLQQYDMNASAGSDYHFQIADADGKSVVVEYIDNEFRTVTSEAPYQACTNFLQSPGDRYNLGKGQDRYETLISGLEEKNGVLSAEEAMELLAAVSQDWHLNDRGENSATQWSVVYNNAKRTGTIAMGRNYDKVYTFSVTQ